jgi:hypothetical protein
MRSLREESSLKAFVEMAVEGGSMLNIVRGEKVEVVINEAQKEASVGFEVHADQTEALDHISNS